MKKKVVIGSIIGIVAAALVVVLIIVLVGNTNQQPLNTNIKSDRVPVFNKTATVAGWQSYSLPSTVNSYEKFTKTNTINLRKTGNTAASATGKYCQAIAQTSFIPSYEKGAGDLYLSKNFAYSQAQATQTTLKDEGIATLNSNHGKIQFVTGAYSATFTNGTGITPSKSSSGKNTPTPSATPVKTTTTKSSTLIAVRAIDALYPNGNSAAALQQPTVSSTASPSASPAPTVPTVGPYNSDATRGVPALTVTYTCYNTEASATEFNKILAGLTVEL